MFCGILLRVRKKEFLKTTILTSLHKYLFMYIYLFFFFLLADYAPFAVNTISPVYLNRVILTNNLYCDKISKLFETLRFNFILRVNFSVLVDRFLKVIIVLHIIVVIDTIN